MMSVPKKANDAIHLSLLEGLDADGLSKEALGDVLLQDRFFVWDSKQLIKKAKERHVFLFETSLVFAKEVSICFFSHNFIKLQMSSNKFSKL